MRRWARRISGPGWKLHNEVLGCPASCLKKRIFQLSRYVVGGRSEYLGRVLTDHPDGVMLIVPPELSSVDDEDGIRGPTCDDVFSAQTSWQGDRRRQANATAVHWGKERPIHKRRTLLLAPCSPQLGAAVTWHFPDGALSTKHISCTYSKGARMVQERGPYRG